MKCTDCKEEFPPVKLQGAGGPSPRCGTCSWSRVKARRARAEVARYGGIVAEAMREATAAPRGRSEAGRLRLLRTSWEASGKTWDEGEARRLIAECPQAWASFACS